MRFPERHSGETRDEDGQSMLGALARHSFIAVLLVVFVDELGIPMPIPSDVLIVLAGTRAGLSVPRLGLLTAVLTAVSALGASGLYAIVRRGGRPLVDRFGHYVHLGPERLARTEALLNRGGWSAIAAGRAVPGLRYATVVTCGLFKVPYARFVSAQLAGSSVYIAAFLLLGAVFGPSVLDRIHLPASGLRLLWLLPLAVGLPLLMARWGSRAHVRGPAVPSSRRSAGAVLLGGFLGTAALTATLSATGTAAGLLVADHPLNAAYILLSRLLGLGPDICGGALISYAVLLVLLVGLSDAYYTFLLPRRAARRRSPERGVSLRRQTLDLALLALGVLGVVCVLALLAPPEGSLDLWRQTCGPVWLFGVALGAVSYALTTVYGRALAIASASSLTRPTSRN